MDEFLLLVRGSYPPRPVPPAGLRSPLQLWQEWLGQLKADGSLVTLPTAFDETGRVLAKDQAVAEGPYVEDAAAIGGVLHIRAADYAAATRIAQGCPVLALGGTVEVRQAL